VHGTVFAARGGFTLECWSGLKKKHLCVKTFTVVPGAKKAFIERLRLAALAPADASAVVSRCGNSGLHIPAGASVWALEGAPAGFRAYAISADDWWRTVVIGSEGKFWWRASTFPGLAYESVDRAAWNGVAANGGAPVPVVEG
jgi:hypothetical protein